jgi:hypothetical protein
MKPRSPLGAEARFLLAPRCRQAGREGGSAEHLHVREMPVTLREAREAYMVERHRGPWVNWVEAIPLVDRHAPADAPFILVTDKAVVKTSEACDVNLDISDIGVDHEDHTRFGDGTTAIDVD